MHHPVDIELKPCPCGHAAQVFPRLQLRGPARAWSAGCSRKISDVTDECAMPSDFFATPARAARAWNESLIDNAS